jgi:hypothetical protein
MGRAGSSTSSLTALVRCDDVGALAHLAPRQADGLSPADSVLLTLALASEPSPTHPLVMLSGPHLLAHALEMSPPPLAVVLPARLGPSVLEQLIDESAADATSPTLVIVGSPDEVEASDIFRLTEERGITAIAWTDIEVTGNDIADQAERPVVGEGDVFSLRIWEAPGGVRRCLLLSSVFNCRPLTTLNLPVPIGGARDPPDARQPDVRHRRPPRPLPRPQATVADQQRYDRQLPRPRYADRPRPALR